MNITLEQPVHAAAIEKLLDSSFGPKRHTKTVYRLRKNVAPVADLCFVATDHDQAGNEVLLGTIRYWPVMLGNAVQALMLGPIAIDPAHRSAGLGGKLIRHSLEAAKALGHRIVILVGDAPYYVRFGFQRDLVSGLSLPGPVDPSRFQGLELVEGALTGVTGMVGRAKPAKVRTAAAMATATASPVATTPVAPTRAAAKVTTLPLFAALLPGDDMDAPVSRRRLRRAAR
ncbi:MAG: GNAT family N-acetyltransferase [Niveispirillum sp.]|uniref:GNAT family N-acetyltransferase n=1 Tax=Niveispirillum sp. TaxID=1917217 RepID=UPI003BA66338